LSALADDIERPFRFRNAVSSERTLPAGVSPTYDGFMVESRSRRTVLTTALALVSASATWGLTAKLLGRSKESKVMQRAQPTTTVSPALRSVERVLSSGAKHWVGDGFHVNGVMSPDGDPRVQSPFLLLDHAARRHFDPSPRPRGVGEHPHRGFETVTFAYRGEVDHRDSSGGGGTIGPGDVQWMTAASGIVHEEKHSRRFSESGGEFEMVQLWVNLPARAKLSAPGYQTLLDKDFPRVELGAARARVIAGEVGGARGPAKTHTPITLFDLEFTSAGQAEFALPAGHSAMTFTLEGEVRVGADERSIAVGQLAVFERGDGSVCVFGAQGARVLVLGGEPIDEPIAAYGPFVMNTREQILQAMRDYQSGKMGHLD
jgi:quercetin 2,3-dioxygenase